jgi:branched-subunit amino acid aminotransferase/4-amino-4-deoxychorismate lyase
MAEGQVHLNGRLLPADEAGVSVADAGFLHGASCFTTMLAHRGVVFRLDRHLSRLLETVGALGLRTGATAESLREATNALLSANGLAEARVRITLTPGPASGGEPTTLITADPVPDYPPEWYTKGISVVVTAFRQAAGPTFGHKTGCYFPRVLARREAAAKGAEEALWYTPDNRLAEACFCNVFLVRGGKASTPPLDTPVLPGIVRGAVIELCGDLGVDCDDRTPLTVRDMLAAEEMFLTSSVAGIRPVARVERHPVGGPDAPTPGERTRIIRQAYLDLLDRECSA